MLARPRKQCTYIMSLCSLIVLMAAIFLSCAWIPSGVITYPNRTLQGQTHTVCTFHFHPPPSQYTKILVLDVLCVTLYPLKTIISSRWTNTHTQIRPASTRLITHWKRLAVVEKPNGMQVNSIKPLWVMNAVLGISSGCIFNLPIPWFQVLRWKHCSYSQ